MRTALLSYRSLFEELLHADGDGLAGQPPSETRDTGARPRPTGSDATDEGME
jgi:hypothetical protein